MMLGSYRLILKNCNICGLSQLRSKIINPVQNTPMLTVIIKETESCRNRPNPMIIDISQFDQACCLYYIVGVANNVPITSSYGLNSSSLVFFIN